MSVVIDRHSVTEAHSNFLVLLMGRQVRGTQFIRDDWVPRKDPYAEQAIAVKLTVGDTGNLPQRILQSPFHPIHSAHFVTASLHPFVNESVGTRQLQFWMLLLTKEKRALCLIIIMLCKLYKWYKLLTTGKSSD